jgi:GxxExxY protein
MHDDKETLDNLTEKTIGCAYTVANTLGNGFLEKVYENALAHELRKSGLNVKQQCDIQVNYNEIVVGEYAGDILVEDAILVEIKAVKRLEDVHLSQCLNYLKATGLKVCLLINFGVSKVEIKRVVNKF